MDMLAAFDDTLKLAEERGMSRQGEALGTGLYHLTEMRLRITPDFSEGKLGRWLGWAQGCVVASGFGTLTEMIELNRRHSTDGRITSAQMPAPDTLVEREDGTVAPAMFFYASEADHPRTIAEEHGFDISALLMQDDPGAVDLVEAEEEGDEKAWLRWDPPVPDGWTYGGRVQTEDGPMTLYLRKRA